MVINPCRDPDGPCTIRTTHQEHDQSMFYSRQARQAVATQALIRASEASAKHYRYLGLTRASECLSGVLMEAYCQLHQQRLILLHGIY